MGVRLQALSKNGPGDTQAWLDKTSGLQANANIYSPMEMIDPRYSN